jgi:hypothetical protein
MKQKKSSVLLRRSKNGSITTQSGFTEDLAGNLAGNVVAK